MRQIRVILGLTICFSTRTFSFLLVGRAFHACLFNYLTYRIIESQSLCSFPIFVKDGNADLMIFFLFYFIFGEGRMFGVIADGKQVQFCVP